MQQVDRLGWAVTVPLRAGNHVLGVRANTHELGELLREVFADRLVPEADPPPNLSVFLAPQATDGPQELHRLYVAYTRTLRTRSAQRLLDAVWHELDMRDVRASGEQLLVDATVLLRDGKAHLLPTNYRRAIVDNERHWREHGFALVDRRWLAIDLSASTIKRVLRPATDPSIDVSFQFGITDRRVVSAAGHADWPIVAWIVDSLGTTLAARVTVAGSQLLDRPTHLKGSTVGQLANLLDQVVTRPNGAWRVPTDPRALVP